MDILDAAADSQPVSDLLAAERQEAVAHVTKRRSDLEAIAVSSMSEVRDDEHDPDGATVAFEHSLAAGLLRRAEAHLAEVDAALGRMAEGTYGRCHRCGTAIPEERLATRPTTVACVQCASTARPGTRRPLRSPI